MSPEEERGTAHPFSHLIKDGKCSSQEKGQQQQGAQLGGSIIEQPAQEMAMIWKPVLLSWTKLPPQHSPMLIPVKETHELVQYQDVILLLFYIL